MAKTTKGKTTLVNFILDKSGSMQVVKNATISGFNEYLNGLKKNKKSKFNFSLTLFDTEIKEVYNTEPINKVKVLNEDTYRPDGMTALYDAVCQTIEKVKDKVKKGQKVLTIIMTDGEENSSKEYTEKNLKELIKKCEKGKNWTFVFLGANQDAWAVAQKFGMARCNVASFHATNRGVGQTFSTMATNTTAFSDAEAASTKSFFSKEDKEKLENTK